LTQDAVVLDLLKIAKAVRYHLDEPDCNHSIKDIVKEALGPAKGPAPTDKTADDAATTLRTNQNGSSRNK
jgi:hypothetical protein